MKRLGVMALAEKQTEGPIFGNNFGLAVNVTMPDDDTNKAFREINGNISGVKWEAEQPELEL